MGREESQFCTFGGGCLIFIGTDGEVEKQFLKFYKNILSSACLSAGTSRTEGVVKGRGGGIFHSYLVSLGFVSSLTSPTFNSIPSPASCAL